MYITIFNVNNNLRVRISVVKGPADGPTRSITLTKVFLNISLIVKYSNCIQTTKCIHNESFLRLSD